MPLDLRTLFKAFEPYHTPGGMQHRGFHGRMTAMLKKGRRVRRKVPIALMKVKAFNPGQKRWPKGSPQGGEWKSSVSGEFLTGGKQGIARGVLRESEKRHGPLPTHRAIVTRRLPKDIGAHYHNGRILLATHSKLPALDTAHEVGHLLDNRRFGAGSFASLGSAKLAGWRRAVDRSNLTKTWRAWNALGHIAFGGNRYFIGKANFRYALDRREQFARSYAQYLARKAGGRLRRDLRIAQKSPVSYYWRDKDFRGIERELDKLFK